MTTAKLELIALPDGGVMLMVNPEGGSAYGIPIPHAEAVGVFLEWWKILSRHPSLRPEETDQMPRPLADAEHPPYVFAAATVDGLVDLLTAPRGCAPMSFRLTPAEARSLAELLQNEANDVEGHQRPN